MKSRARIYFVSNTQKNRIKVIETVDIAQLSIIACRFPAKYLTVMRFFAYNHYVCYALKVLHYLMVFGVIG